MDGGPLRCWVVVGTPARVLHAWASLTGAPALPPAWALGHHHARWGFGSEQEVRRIVAGYQAHGLPLDAVHLDIDHYDEHQVFTVDHERFPMLPVLAEELRRDGIRLVSVVDPAVKAEPGNAVYDSGTAEDAFVRDASGRLGTRSRMAPGGRFPGLHPRACAGVVGRPLQGTARAGVHRLLARHERADVVRRLRGVDAAAFGPARPRRAGRRPS